MEKLLTGKTALVTGASKGIGEAIAIKFAENGANVAITYLNNKQKADEVVEKLIKLGIEAKSYKCDASKYDECEDLVTNILNDFSTIDILVNNAGITRDNLFLRMKEEDWDEVINNNLKSVFNTTKACIKIFMKSRSGSIINMSSIVGLKGNAGQANYAASKSGIIGFTKSLALELGPRGIRSNVIAPGYIETEMTSGLKESIKEEWTKTIPLRRSGQVEDISNGALFLASDMSSYITGQVIQIDGGLLT